MAGAGERRGAPFERFGADDMRRLLPVEWPRKQLKKPPPRPNRGELPVNRSQRRIWDKSYPASARRRDRRQGDEEKVAGDKRRQIDREQHFRIDGASADNSP